MYVKKRYASGSSPLELLPLAEPFNELVDAVKVGGDFDLLGALGGAFAAAICRDSQSPGVKCMGDFWHMKEETSDYAALMSAGTKYLQHIHIASRKNRCNPGEDGEADNYVDGFRALKEMGYNKYISLECGNIGDPAVAIPAAVELIKAQWEQA